MGKKRRDGRAAKRGNSAPSSNAVARNSGGGVCLQGGTYNGQLKGGKPHGQGRLDWGDGDVYEGEFKEGVGCGRGAFKWADGRFYDGEWREGEQHGKGTYRWGDGRIYEGEFAGGAVHGWGAMTWPSGRMYEGQWAEGNMHGNGKMVHPTGEIFEGEFKDGYLHGKGKVKYPSGVICEGIWMKGKFAKRKLRSQRSQQRRLEVAKKTCEHCGVDDHQYKLQVCSGCNLALYCSDACQKAASRSHRRICGIISELPSRDSDRLNLEYDKDKMVDLDAGLRYGTKYMGNLKHLAIKIEEMASGDAIKLSTKQLSSLLKSKRRALESVVFSLSDGHGYEKVCGIIEATVWLELHGLKHLRLRGTRFNGVKSVCDIIHQQKDTLEVLCLPFLGIDWRKAKNRRTIAQGIGSCRHLVHLNLEGCLLMDADLKVVLQDLPNLRILGLTRYGADAHEFTDNTCGLIARKCPRLQELSLLNHNQLSVKGVRKVFEGCTHLRSFYTSTRKLSCKDFQSLLDIAPQLTYLYLGGETRLSNSEISEIIEATGGRVVFQLSVGGVFEPVSVSAKTWEAYECQHAALSSIWLRQDDPIANVWTGMLEG
ncbi:hypothetical protein ACHAXT_001698 [Thalassiosira profunda]